VEGSDSGLSGPSAVPRQRPARAIALAGMPAASSASCTCFAGSAISARSPLRQARPDRRRVVAVLPAARELAGVRATRKLPELPEKDLR
jgi:hypothetical protein